MLTESCGYIARSDYGEQDSIPFDQRISVSRASRAGVIGSIALRPKVKRSRSLHNSISGRPSGAGVPNALGWRRYLSLRPNRHSRDLERALARYRSPADAVTRFEGGIDRIAFGIQTLMNSTLIRQMTEFFCRASVGCATASRNGFGRVRSVTVSSSGRNWFVPILAVREVERPIPRGPAIGIDMGSSVFQTQSAKTTRSRNAGVSHFEVRWRSGEAKAELVRGGSSSDGSWNTSRDGTAGGAMPRGPADPGT